MAPLAKHVSFFLLLVLISSIHIEARVGKFLTKTTHNHAPEPAPQALTLAHSITATAPAHIEGGISFPSEPVEGGIGYAPTPIEGGNGYAPAPVEGEIGNSPAPVESDNPYGLYGGDPTEFSTKKMTTAATTTTTFGNDQQEEILADEFANERLQGEYNSGSQYTTNNNYNNHHYSNNYYDNNNGYSNSGYNNNGYSNSGYNYNKGYANSYYNGYKINEQQGMSDTGFLENGKYYYDLSNENHDHNKYDQAVKGNGYTEGYDGYGEKSKYEFDTMEEYEKQQGYPDTDMLYNP